MRNPLNCEQSWNCISCIHGGIYIEYMGLTGKAIKENNPTDDLEYIECRHH